MSTCAFRQLPRQVIATSRQSLITSRLALDCVRRPQLSYTFNTSRQFGATATMSTQYKYEYFVTIPDHENALDKRLAARPTHLNNLKPHIDSGRVVFGGAMLSKQPAEGESPDMKGSVMLIKANSEQEVRDMIEGDAYTK